MKKIFVVAALLFGMASTGWALSERTSNNPCFLWIDMISNGYGTADSNAIRERFISPETVDIGVDVGADGEVDAWLSDEVLEYFYRDNREDVQADWWRRFHLRLDSFAGPGVTARLVIVDRSPDYYLAINTIRLNYADGRVVPNNVPNGDFEADSLQGWTITEGSISDPAALVVRDETGEDLPYGFQYLSTKVNGNEDTVVLQSDEFALEPISSFVYLMASGGVSERFNRNEVSGSDQASYIYLDVGTETEPPNGQYDPEGDDIPYTGFLGGDAFQTGEQAFHSGLINTSGLEGRQAQLVVVDDSEFYHIAIDGVRMNYDNNHIPNGGFEEGIPEAWYDFSTHLHTEHPSGGIPGWEVIAREIDGAPGDGEAFYNDGSASETHKSGRTYVGTGGFSGAERFLRGTEIRSSVFTIESIPDPADSVYLTFISAQGITEIGADARASVELQIDVNENGSFEDAEDVILRADNQGLAWNAQNSSLDHVHTPRYRIYVPEEYQGLPGRIFATDERTGGWDWMVVDDFYFVAGGEVMLPFENSDFENGDFTNWEFDNRNPSDLRDGLSGSQDLWIDGVALHRPLNNRVITQMQGNWQFDTADHSTDGGPGGDGGDASITSVVFTIPSAGSAVGNWNMME